MSEEAIVTKLCYAMIILLSWDPPSLPLSGGSRETTKTACNKQNHQNSQCKTLIINLGCFKYNILFSQNHRFIILHWSFFEESPKSSLVSNIFEKQQRPTNFYLSLDKRRSKIRSPGRKNLIFLLLKGIGYCLLVDR